MFETRTTKQISDNIQAQLDAAFGTARGKSFSRVLSKTLGAVYTTLYKYGGFMHLQIFVDTASMKETEVNGKMISPLRLWGNLIGAGDPFPATQAEHVVRLQTEVEGAEIAKGSQLIYAPTGLVFVLLDSVVMTGESVDVNVRAVADPEGNGGAGAQGNLSSGTILSFASPYTGVNRSAQILSTLVTGTEGETEDAYRARVKSRFGQRPKGGAYIDYKIWAEDTPGVKEAYPYAGALPGTVKVYIESSTEPDGIPTPSQLQAALDSINFNSDTGLAERRPVGALVNTFPILMRGYQVTVTGLSVENPVQVRSDVETALRLFFADKEPYLVGLSVPTRKDRITLTAITGVVDDVVSQAGGIFTSVATNQTAVYTLAEGEKAKLAGVTFA